MAIEKWEKVFTWYPSIRLVQPNITTSYYCQHWLALENLFYWDLQYHLQAVICSDKGEENHYA